jgi:formylglycine-generating enzyme required for sulfatase activity
MACQFWAGAELDARVKRHADILKEFFQLPGRVQAGTPSADAVAGHRAALRARLEDEARRQRGGMSFYSQEEGATLPIEACPYQAGRLGRREDLLATLLAADRLLVLGEPGSGKTVALDRLAWQLCGEQEPRVPVLVRLFRYDGERLSEWVRATLQEMGHLRLDDEQALVAFLREGEARCVFLFDGLNEAPPGYRDTLVGELVRWMKAHPRHPVILTSRSQDELWRRLAGEIGGAVVVQPIDDEQARAYLVAHLDTRGEALYDRLDPRLRAMARTPLLLWLIKEAGAAGESIPGNRGELYDRFVSRMLAGDTDRHLKAEVNDRVKRGALTDLAYHLSLGQRLSCRHEEAVAAVARRVGEELADRVVGACRQHGLLAGEETLWFAPHQTMQEYFAALALRELVAQEWAQGGWRRVWRAGRRMLTGRGVGLAALAGDDWWAETFVQLAGLTENADRLARELARLNPWLAWWCVEEGREVSQETRETIADRSVELLKSGKVVDRRRAVATLAQMRNEWVLPPLFRAAADRDPEVAGLAVQALLEMGETAREQALVLARQPEHALHQAGLVYLEAVLGLPVVWVAPGPFLMGSDRARDPYALDDELPQHQVWLPGYWIGRYPVTVAQFRTFVEASGYELEHKDSLRGEDDHPVVSVTWYDVLAYGRWLSEKSGLPVRLPSEAEWEKAARGTDGRIYPWGDEVPDENRCNYGGKVGGTTPVGDYSPAGDSPYGCADMAGNVWEWTRSLWGEKPDFQYPYDPEDGREDTQSTGLRVVRGGSWYFIRLSARCAARSRYDPRYRWYLSGFRILVAPISP